ncbi:MAG: hypothetical protein U0L71_06430 [Eggerthellaceae bacterium]|nr:hypothetical protein [Eggerthellaceae bacterium]
MDLPPRRDNTAASCPANAVPRSARRVLRVAKPLRMQLPGSAGTLL